MPISLARRGRIAASRRRLSAIVTDSFNRANGNLGTADSGQTWVALQGTIFGISSNQAYNQGGASDTISSINTLVTNMDVQVTAVNVTDNGPCIIARATDALNTYLLAFPGSGNVTLYKRVSNSFTSLGSASAASAGDIMRLVVNGSSLTAYRNGTSIITATDSALTTGTHAGLRADTSTARFDDFSVS